MPGTIDDAVKDPDFLKAPVTQQMAYLSHIDPDFAAGKPEDKLAYLNHVTGKQAPTTANNSVEKAGAGVPENYGFTPGHIASSAWDAAKQLGATIYDTGKDVGSLAYSAAKDQFTPGAPTETIGKLKEMGKKYLEEPENASTVKAGEALNQADKDTGLRKMGDYAVAGGHALAGALPVIGPYAESLGERAGSGDVGGAATQAAVQIGGPKLLPKVVPAAVSGAIDVATGGKPTPEGVVKNVLTVQKAGIKEPGYAGKVQAAVPDLQQIAADNKGAIQTPRDMVDAIEQHISNLEEPIAQAAKSLDKSGHIVDVTQPITSKVSAALEKNRGAAGFNPAAQDHAVADISGYLEHAKTPYELENLRRSLNDQAAAYYKADPATRASINISEPQAVAARAAADALRDELYGADGKPGIYENAGMQGDVRALRQRVGSLIDIRNHVQDAITRGERTGNWDALKTVLTRNPSGGIMSGGIGAILGGMLAGPVGAVAGGVLGEGYNALKNYRESVNPNLNVQKAFGKLERMGAPTNLPSVEFRPPAAMPKSAPITGTQQTLPHMNDTFFPVGQTPAPTPAAAPPAIHGEQMGLPHMNDTNPLFSIGQTAPPPAPATVGPLAKIPGREYNAPDLGKQAPGGPNMTPPALQLPAVPTQARQPSGTKPGPQRASLIEKARQRAQRIRDARLDRENRS
jgi:hypothetical protein